MTKSSLAVAREAVLVGRALPRLVAVRVLELHRVSPAVRLLHDLDGAAVRSPVHIVCVRTALLLLRRGTSRPVSDRRLTLAVELGSALLGELERHGNEVGAPPELLEARNLRIGAVGLVLLDEAVLLASTVDLELAEPRHVLVVEVVAVAERPLLPVRVALLRPVEVAGDVVLLAIVRQLVVALALRPVRHEDVPVLFARARLAVGHGDEVAVVAGALGPVLGERVALFLAVEGAGNVVGDLGRHRRLEHRVVDLAQPKQFVHGVARLHRRIVLLVLLGQVVDVALERVTCRRDQLDELGAVGLRSDAQLVVGNAEVVDEVGLVRRRAVAVQGD
mmetsp:Transcript_5220/g.8861  ORF Transcript_5220/g.8861 Transcript_5220/m.8861 type:complete len:334 (-) Transcript_5220:539-1540(-)